MSHIRLEPSNRPGIAMGTTDQRLWLKSIFGMVAGLDGSDEGPDRARGPGTIRTDDGCFEGSNFSITQVDHSNDQLIAQWRIAGCPIELTTEWSICPDTGVVRRVDRLHNTSRQPVTIFRYLSRLPLQPGDYEIYAQLGRWGRENLGAWTPLHAAGLVLSNSAAGRTTVGCSPYAAVRDLQTGRGLWINLVPQGNWTIRMQPVPMGQGTAALSIEWGQSDDDLKLTLAPGERWQSPEVLLGGLESGEVESGAAPLHRYALRRWFADAKPEIPVIFNTWLDQFDNLEPERLRRQLAAAKQIGCEVFVIDAGWFGQGRGDWFEMTGHWHERPDSAFGGRMRDFADEVRAAGLGFGLWMEPEHFGSQAPLRAEHPDWFKGSREPGRGPRLDLENPQAYAWLRKEIQRLIDNYHLAWIKLDANIELGHDEAGSELNRYYQAWFRMLDDLRRSNPQTIIEGCAGGGARLDLNILAHHDAHFLSDNTNPVDTVRIGEAALLRLPPGRLERWLTVRSVGRTVPHYPFSAAEAPESFAFTAAGAWQSVQSAELLDLSFAAIAAMLGVMGVSSDLASLSPEARQLLARYVEFWSRWRRFIIASHAHLLTVVRGIDDRTGWSATQLCCDGRPESLVFAYRLQDQRGVRLLPLRDLDSRLTYRISRFDADGSSEVEKTTGQRLMLEGLIARLSRAGTACIYVMEPE